MNRRKRNKGNVRGIKNDKNYSLSVKKEGVRSVDKERERETEKYKKEKKETKYKGTF
jgi:hypothetical protein